jgi:hypothetical protein
MRKVLMTILVTLVVVYFSISLYGKYHINQSEITIIEITEVRPGIYVIYAMDKEGTDQFYLSDSTETVFEIVDADQQATDKILMAIQLINQKKP